MPRLDRYVKHESGCEERHVTHAEPCVKPHFLTMPQSRTTSLITKWKSWLAQDPVVRAFARAAHLKVATLECIGLLLELRHTHAL